MDDLLQEFLVETSESMGELDNQLIALESDPTNEGIISSIFRLLHTIKGTCGFLGLSRLEHVAHAGEDVLGKYRDKSMAVSSEGINLVLEAFDVIKHIMSHLESEGTEPAGDDTSLINRLRAYIGEGDAPAHGNDADFGNFLEDISATAPAAEEEAPAPKAKGKKTPKGKKAAKTEEEPAEEIEAEKVEETPVVAEAPKPAPAPVKLPEAAKPKPAAAEHGDDNKNAAGVQTIRVGIDVLEQLMQTISELVLTRNQLNQIVRSKHDQEFVAPIQRLSHITTELQDGIMKTRMQPIGNAWSKLPRLVRDTSKDLGKEIELVMKGEDTELDRQLLEVIRDPLTHMVRNSVDHGLEKPDERIAAGKPSTGTVRLSAYHEGGHIIIEVADDGRGLNTDRIRQKIIEKGLAHEADVAAMSRQQVHGYIFHAGFSTAEQVTNISGRGVGMDVVRSNIEKIGGSIEILSEIGQGSTFRIKIPLTLAIVPVLIVGTQGSYFAVPQINVVELVYCKPESHYRIETIENSPVMRLRERLLPIISLGALMGLCGEAIPATCYVVVCKVGNYEFGMLVDRVFDTEEIVVKPVASMLASVDLYSGSTILGDGRVIMILDPNALARRSGEAAQDTGKQDTGIKNQQMFDERNIPFLVFSAADDTPKAVPLDLVSRLEEISPDQVEHSGEAYVLQYRGDLMRLFTLNGQLEKNAEGNYSIIVFNYEGKMLGLVVKEIVDIISGRMEIKMSAHVPYVIGSMVLNGKTTDVLDAGAVMLEAFGNTSRKASSGNGVGDAQQHIDHKETILIVDDSPFFRTLSAPFLSAKGFQVLTAGSAFEVVDMLKARNDIKLIVSDVEMPEMSGIELAELLTNDARYKHIPIIAFSSAMNADLIRQGMNAGFKAYVSKTDRDGLLREVENALAAAPQPA
ncbi:response regulator [bacterium]|nr:response regulator [bacterium]